MSKSEKFDNLALQLMFSHFFLATLSFTITFSIGQTSKNLGHCFVWSNLLLKHSLKAVVAAEQRRVVLPASLTIMVELIYSRNCISSYETSIHCSRNSLWNWIIIFEEFAHEHRLVIWHNSPPGCTTPDNIPLTVNFGYW